MMKRMRSVIGQLMAFLSAAVGYLRSASAFFTLASFQPLISVGPIFMTTLSFESAGRLVEVKDSPDLVRKSLARSQSVKFDQGPTKMWKLHSFACTDTTLFFANVSS